MSSLRLTACLVMFLACFAQAAPPQSDMPPLAMYVYEVSLYLASSPHALGSHTSDHLKQHPHTLYRMRYFVFPEGLVASLLKAPASSIGKEAESVIALVSLDQKGGRGGHVEFAMDQEGEVFRNGIHVEAKQEFMELLRTFSPQVTFDKWFPWIRPPEPEEAFAASSRPERVEVEFGVAQVLAEIEGTKRLSLKMRDMDGHTGVIGETSEVIEDASSIREIAGTIRRAGFRFAQKETDLVRADVRFSSGKWLRISVDTVVGTEDLALIFDANLLHVVQDNSVYRAEQENILEALLHLVRSEASHDQVESSSMSTAE